MPNALAFLREHVVAGGERHHPSAPAVVAAVGTCMHQLKDAAPIVLISMSRLLPHPLTAQLAAPVAFQPQRVSVHEWDPGRWFVTTADLGMLGEIELTGCCYRVSFASDARGAAFGFESLALAVEHFDEYASALDL